MLLARALAIRWASSNAWMPENTEPELVVVSAVDSVMALLGEFDAKTLLFIWLNKEFAFDLESMRSELMLH